MEGGGRGEKRGQVVWEFEVPFYSVQDCRMYCVKL